MLTLRAYAALAGLALVTALALSLIAWGREREVSAGLRRELREAHAQRDADVRAARAQGERNALSVAQAAQTCGQEGSAAFDRGVQVGMAVCEARR